MIVSSELFMRIVDRLGDQARDDIAWAQGLKAPSDPDEFALEVAFVICNSGMQNKVARRIYDRCAFALMAGTPVRDVFGHAGKAAAIERVWAERKELLGAYLASTNRLAFLETLPWIGAITKYHLAKNFGEDVAKPDVHLQRLADREGCTVEALCQRLASATGFRVATIDTVLWRACADGVLNSRTGAFEAV